MSRYCVTFNSRWHWYFDWNLQSPIVGTNLYDSNRKDLWTTNPDICLAIL
jgi:hypothetical protein